MRPSERSMRAPGSTSRARPRKSVEISAAVPATWRGVMVTRAPGSSITGFAVFKPSSANLGALQVLKNTDGALQAARSTAQPLDPARVLRMCSVREIQAGHIHAKFHQVANTGFGITGRTNRADDFCAAHARRLSPPARYWRQAGRRQRDRACVAPSGRFLSIAMAGCQQASSRTGLSERLGIG